MYLTNASSRVTELHALRFMVCGGHSPKYSKDGVLSAVDYANAKSLTKTLSGPV